MYGGPGTGKSTTAADLFARMKQRGMKVELVTEYAKDLTYDESWRVRSDQLAILGEQWHRLYRLNDKVDFVVTDCPLLLGLVYARGVFNESWFTTAVVGAYRWFDNLDVLLNRVKPYAAFGRDQTPAQAKHLDIQIENVLRGYGRSETLTLDADETAAPRILNHLEA